MAFWQTDPLLSQDRESASPGLAEWLKNAYDVEVTLRIKASMYTKRENMLETKIAKLMEMMGKGSQQAVPKLIYIIQFSHILSQLGNY